MQIQMLMIKFMNMLGEETAEKLKTDYEESWFYSLINPVIKILDQLLVPVIIILGVAGTIYAIVLGVQYSKAETADKRDEAKKRMINAIIGIVIMLVILIVMKVFIDNAPEIANWVNTSGEGTEATTAS